MSQYKGVWLPSTLETLKNKFKVIGKKVFVRINADMYSHVTSIRGAVNTLIMAHGKSATLEKVLNSKGQEWRLATPKGVVEYEAVKIKLDQYVEKDKARRAEAEAKRKARAKQSAITQIRSLSKRFNIDLTELAAQPKADKPVKAAKTK